VTAQVRHDGVYEGHVCNFCGTFSKVPSEEHPELCVPNGWAEIRGVCAGAQVAYDICEVCRAAGRGALTPEGHPPHFWGICGCCGTMVHCGACLNNCCSGGRGTLPLGTPFGKEDEPGTKPCPFCEAAYAFQRLENPPEDVKQRAKELLELMAKRYADPEWRRANGYVEYGDVDWGDGPDKSVSIEGEIVTNEDGSISLKPKPQES
jgi:hypothetical protein